MITFPNAKINLGLNITAKRPDGYHNLETVFYPVPIEDALEIHVLNNSTDKKFALHQAGMEITGNAEDNLVVKAYLLLDKEFNLPPVDIHLYKHIPSGAGLGGGSSDAAFMLKLLNERFELKLTDEKLEEYIRSRLCFFYKEYPNLCRRNRKYLLPSFTLFKGLSDSVSQTGYLRFHPGSLLTGQASRTGIFIKRNYNSSRQ